jgi:hypothetical protein
LTPGGGDTNPYSYTADDPINYGDPDGLLGLPHISLREPLTFVAGGFDIVSFGLTAEIRSSLGGNEALDLCSSWYAAGEVAGLVTITALTDGLGGEAAAVDEGGLIYRTGSQTDNALTDSTGLSFRDSISSSADRTQVFRRGDKIWSVDTSKLPSGSVIRDGVPPGHVTVNATPAQIRNAIVDDPTLRDLGLNVLDDGSYRLPK